jgi:hypothetical protein
LLAASYPLLNAMWTMLIFFAWVIWIFLLITVIMDVFRRHDVSGWGKSGWILLMIVLPFIGVLIYVGAHGGGMAERNAQAQAMRYDSVVPASSTSDPATQIAQAKELLDSGAITQPEFDSLKRKALA